MMDSTNFIRFLADLVCCDKVQRQGGQTGERETEKLISA